MRNVIFFSGIHGVGKGFISEKIKSKINIPIYSASELIRLNGISSDTNKKVDNVTNNQKQLIKSINDLIKDKIFVLDGHTCLINNQNEIESIKLEIFKEMNIIGAILILDDINLIKDRIYKRDFINFDLELLARLQKSEIRNMKMISNDLNIPLLFFKNGDNIQNIVDFIKVLEEKVKW